MTTTSSNPNAPIKTIYIQVPIGIPTADGGLEIPNRVFLGGIATETTEMDLEIFFSEYGAVKDVRIVTDRYTGENKGYGFVTFNDDEDISKLLSKRSITMKGKRLRVRKAIRRNGSQFDNCNRLNEHSSLMLPAEQYVIVPHQQSSPPTQLMPQLTYQPNYTVPSAGSAMHYTTMPQNMQPVYYMPYMNSPQMQVPVMTSMVQQMQIS